MKKAFEVTEKAGDWVAGRRSPGQGETLQLTDEEARYEVIAGTLKAPAETTKADKRKPRAEAPALPNATGE